MAQLVARVVWDHQAAGSSPVTPTKTRCNQRLHRVRLSKKAREHKRRKDKGKFFSKTNIDQKQMHVYLKSLEVSNFKGFSAYFARMSPLGVYTYTFGFHSDNLTPFWTVSSVSINLSTRCGKHFVLAGVLYDPRRSLKFVRSRSAARKKYPADEKRPCVIFQ